MFSEYISKPCVRKACKIGDSALKKIDDQTMEYCGVQFKHHEKVVKGDYIVYLDDTDIYHCRKEVFEERNFTQGVKQSPIIKYFSFAHLPTNLREVSQAICCLAKELDKTLPANAEKTAGLRKLLEAKDCFVRAIL